MAGVAAVPPIGAPNLVDMILDVAPAGVARIAASELTEALIEGTLRSEMAVTFPLDQIAEAPPGRREAGHDRHGHQCRVQLVRGGGLKGFAQRLGRSTNLTLTTEEAGMALHLTLGQRLRQSRRPGSAASHGSDDVERLPPVGDLVGQGLVGRRVRQVDFAGEEPHEWPPQERVGVADGAPQGGVAGLEGIEDAPLGDRVVDVEAYLAGHPCEGAQVMR